MTTGIDRAAIERTYGLITPYIRVTPVVETSGADFGLAAFPLAFKLELFQHAGSFKTRGAFTNLLTRAIPAAGVVAASGGNHGAAVAYAAMRLGVKARIFVPTVSSPAKISRIRGYGADLVVTGDRYADALAASQVWAAESGAPTLTRALEAGKPVDAPAGGLAADSLAPRRVGELMFPIARAHIARVLLLGDAAIRRAQAALWATLRVVAEPGGAAAFSALLSGAYGPAPGERVGVVVSGGNTTAVDFDR